MTYLPSGELTAQCDIISLHCAVTDETREMWDGAFLARMKPNSILVNCGRGDLVDNQALRKALIDGTIRGAALDTIFPEPTPATTLWWTCRRRSEIGWFTAPTWGAAPGGLLPRRI